MNFEMKDFLSFFHFNENHLYDCINVRLGFATTVFIRRGTAGLFREILCLQVLKHFPIFRKTVGTVSIISLRSLYTSREESASIVLAEHFASNLGNLVEICFDICFLSWISKTLKIILMKFNVTKRGFDFFE